MVPPMEELCGCVTEWRDILLGKRLDVNATKYIVMVENTSVVSVGKECMLRYVYRM